jgi:hypothetical protein
MRMTVERELMRVDRWSGGTGESTVRDVAFVLPNASQRPHE